MTRNGSGRAWVFPSIVTCSSFMASRSADWVLGVERLISSARTTCEKIGPGLNSNWVSRWLNTDRPRMSEGKRSLVNWMRRKEASIAWASATPSRVLPMPGTSSMSRWPLARSVATVSSTTSGLLMKTCPMVLMRRSIFPAAAASALSGIR